jgi:hypothetical protein
VPLPPPAQGKYVNQVAQGVLPWKPHALEVGRSQQPGDSMIEPRAPDPLATAASAQRECLGGNCMALRTGRVQQQLSVGSPTCVAAGALRCADVLQLGLHMHLTHHRPQHTYRGMHAASDHTTSTECSQSKVPACSCKLAQVPARCVASGLTPGGAGHYDMPVRA